MKIELSQALVSELIAIDNEKRSSDHDVPMGVSKMSRLFNLNIIETLIYSIPLEQKRQLAAVMWLGRDEYDEFSVALNYARRFADDDMAQYIASKPLGEYLPKGLERLQKAGIQLAD